MYRKRELMQTMFVRQNATTSSISYYELFLWNLKQRICTYIHKNTEYREVSLYRAN